MPLVSLIIPTFNGAPWLEKGLTRIFDQSIVNQIEVLIIDSGSTDNTLSIIKKFPVRLHQISNREFNHGGTRNKGVQMAKGEYILLTVQDALPASEQWIERMLSHFDSERVAGVCGGQAVPHEKDKNPIQWHRPQSASMVKKYFFESKAAFQKLTSTQKNKICSWDNVNAMYKKEALLNIPFRNISFAEDIAWSHDAILQQKELIYDHGCYVYHYHHHTHNYTYDRVLLDTYFRYQLNGFSENTPFKYPFKKFAGWVKTLAFHSGNLAPGDIIYWLNYNFRVYCQTRKAIIDFKKELKKTEASFREFIKANEVPVSLHVKE